MRADNTRYVVAAARRRSAATHKRAADALRRMHTRGVLITFETVAHEAGVSRSWLYGQPALRSQIEQQRARTQLSHAHPPIPARQRSSDTSLLRRLEIAAERIRELEQDNQQLRIALAHALGDHRERNQ
jgi:Family of unknown function (DUF6262)